MGKSETLDKRELLAAGVMILSLEGRVWNIVPRDVKGAPDKTHDFDLIAEDTTVAVEVSTIARTEAVGGSARWSREFPDLTATAQGIKSGWILMAEASADGRRIRSKLDGWLSALEKMQVRSLETESFQKYVFEPESTRPEWYETAFEMRQAGISHVEIIAELAPGVVSVCLTAPIPTYGLSDTDYVSRFVFEQLDGPHASDIRKLESAIADRRSLFLWIDPQSHLELIRAIDHNLLQGSVTGAGGVDELWLGRHFRDGSVTVYRWVAGKKWQTLAFTEAALDAARAHVAPTATEHSAPPTRQVLPPTSL